MLPAATRPTPTPPRFLGAANSSGARIALASHVSGTRRLPVPWDRPSHAGYQGRWATLVTSHHWAENSMVVTGDHSESKVRKISFDQTCRLLVRLIVFWLWFVILFLSSQLMMTENCLKTGFMKSWFPAKMKSLLKPWFPAKNILPSSDGVLPKWIPRQRPTD